ncbi:N-acetylmuramidase domain-containing protein [Nitratireductor alexandrii]|uniref:N-acetylmuramidase domain-containing protein n=1 Tax=Nitratireductor alexandrii TaxID=2448161 RepID=UPI000FD88AF5|nr:N-acetylmuramidase domain-containing protein [Nitratireductor alexandrii]
MFSKEIIQSITAAAARHALAPATLLAVADVESAGKPFATVAGRREPVIRFEGHYFDRRLRGAQRARARAAGLASPEPGSVANPRTQAARWALLERACAIDRKAALESVSWGIGQVMGAHWAWLGYASVESMVDEARSGVEGQIAIMLRYIDKAGLTAALRRRDWAAFAKGYNGPGYRKYGYDRKIARAVARYEAVGTAAAAPASAIDAGAATVPVTRGATGARVRSLQARLTAAGHAVDQDGVFGPATERALRAFQRRNGLRADGIAGPKTWRALADDGQEANKSLIWQRLLAALRRALSHW